MKRKLLLINPVNPSRIGLTVNRSSRFPPLGLGIVASLTPASWDVELLDETWEQFEYHQADLVGITAFTANVSRAYEIAQVYRSNRVPVIMGGIHASMCPDEASQFVDCVVQGEAEAVWLQIIADFEAGRLKASYSGTWDDLTGVPPPRHDLFNPGYMFASVQTSRGCPMDCSFCSVTAFNGRRYRRRPVLEVLDEISNVPQRMVFFVDDNIIGYGDGARHGAIELFRGMVDRKLDKWWFCQASINFADDEEVLAWAARAGCKMVFLGLESEDETSLAEVDKHLNLKKRVSAYREAFQRIHRAGIAVLGAFIFGMDCDTPAKLEARADYMINSDVDVMQVTNLTPLPGTRLFTKLHGDRRLIYTDYPGDWARYDMTQIVHKPANMGTEEFAAAVSRCNSRIYSWPVLLRKALMTLLLTRRPMAAMFAFQSNINYRNVGEGHLKEQARAAIS
ncbi:MAG: B12-binding domain-containing radical SAM protein [Dehalococcoidia bacterium]|nr:B12-binding domain-containing radical SAM protein [Dehalococcoidia bacterium]